MPVTHTRIDLERKIHDFVRRDFHPKFGQLTHTFPTNATWQRLRELGTELWLDTGSLDEATPLWTREFTALTTNNTLLNREVQKGTYDSLIAEANRLLASEDLDEHERILEIAFILNACHGLRLVERFDAYVSVEEHTDLAMDYDLAVAHARRYHAICPERFIVKIPMTPAGLLATRTCWKEGIPVNHTLGFSARQNYLVARVGRPKFVNVFLGRLNSFVVDNHLGDGQYVGEKATLASQAALAKLRQTHGVPSRQIGASFRGGGQVRDLVGMDVMTLPPKVAQEFLALNVPADQLADQTGQQYSPGVRGEALRQANLDTLWTVRPELATCVDALELENLDSFMPEDLTAFLAEHGFEDLLVDWTAQQRATSAQEGKIPQLANWRELLEKKAIGLDSLMNLAGLNSFIADQKAMDERVINVLRAGGV